MITMPLSLAILAFGVWPVIGLCSYAFGWWWRGRFERREATRTIHTAARDMTPDEVAAFDEGFGHMDRAFQAFDRGFGRR